MSIFPSFRQNPPKFPGKIRRIPRSAVGNRDYSHRSLFFDFLHLLVAPLYRHHPKNFGLDGLRRRRDHRSGRYVIAYRQ